MRLKQHYINYVQSNKRETFATMLGRLEAAHAQKKAKGGRPNAMCVPEMLLMALEYLREYRTYFHIGTAYGVGESTAYKHIRWVEDVLVKDGTFALPGRKELLKSDTDIEVVLVDATESPVQRPKKNSVGSARARRNATR